MRMMARPLVPTGSRPVLRASVRQSHVRSGPASTVNQRRRQVVAGLALSTTIMLSGAIMTASDVMIYGFVASAIAMSAYCYQLAQRRRSANVGLIRPGYRRVA